MPIKVTCQCNQTFAVKDELAGKTIKCPKCSQPLLIPAAAQPAASATEPPPQNNDEPCPSCQAPFPQDKMVCANCGYSRRLGRRIKNQAIETSTASAGSAAQQPPPSKRTKPKRPRVKRPLFSINGGSIAAGIAMMLGAVIWLVLGLLGGRLFFYPFFLFVAVFGALLKGLFGDDQLAD